MNTDKVSELLDLELEVFSSGKGGKGGGGGGGGGFDSLLKFQEFQRNTFINSGVNPGSSAFERLAARGVDISAVQ